MEVPFTTFELDTIQGVLPVGYRLRRDPESLSVNLYQEDQFLTNQPLSDQRKAAILLQVKAWNTELSKKFNTNWSIWSSDGSNMGSWYASNNTGDTPELKRRLFGPCQDPAGAYDRVIEYCTANNLMPEKPPADSEIEELSKAFNLRRHQPPQS